MTFVMCGTTTATGQAVFEDSGWWQSLSHNEQLIAVEGMMVGYTQGFAAGAVGEDLPLKPTRAELVERAHQLDRVAQSALVGTPYTSAMIADRISAIYREKPGLAHLAVVTLCVCAATTADRCEGTADEFERESELPEFHGPQSPRVSPSQPEASRPPS
jgi:hypothetical protein